MGAICGKNVQHVNDGEGKPSEPPQPNKSPQQQTAASPSNAKPDTNGVKHGTDNPFDRYIVKSSLGKGRYGTVKVGVEKATGKEYAIKIINGKTLKDLSIIDEEVFKLKKVGNHPNIVAFHEFFKDDASGMFYIVMELCKGGDLFSRIVEDGSYNEKRAAELLRQLANALVFIHGLGITHRDLSELFSDLFVDVDIFNLQSLKTYCCRPKIQMLR
jgi:serine/threonine protein kinase